MKNEIKQTQDTKILPYFKTKLTKREIKIIGYLKTFPNEYIPIAQITKAVGFDKRSTCDLLYTLYQGAIIHRRREKFKATANGGRRFEIQYKVDLLAAACLPITPQDNNNFLLGLKQRNKKLFKTIFNFGGENV
ncbi:hypothetical protein LCGC14_1400770 [marine sediment metagenome]|uniref:Uncharacterized protein n=1 Tax=marine sediment metagenome TaxID=412755 RepID=A0A0F9JXG2_9ZZZZ